MLLRLRERLRVVRLVAPGAVDAVVPEVEEERPVPVFGDEFHRFVREPIHDVFARRAVGDGPDALLPARFAV